MPSEGWKANAPLLFAGVSAWVIALFSDPLTIPDSFELIAEGGCMVGQEQWSTICGDLNPAYWTPGWSLPVGIFSYFLSPLAAAGVVSLLSMALLVVPCWALGSRLGGAGSGAAAAVLVLSTPALQTYGLLADGRSLALLCLFSCWALGLRALSEEKACTWGAVAGAMAGFGVLVRPEGILTLLLLPIFLGVMGRSWKLALSALGGGTLLAAPWWAILSSHRGRLGFTPRDWEASGFPLLEILPKREVLELYGMGARDTPFRELALQSDVHPPGVGIDLFGGVAWLGEHLPQTVPWWALIMAILGLVLAVRSGRWREVLVLGLAGLPSVIAAFKPQSRDVLLPMANFLPLIVCAWVFAGVLLERVASRVGERWGVLRLTQVLALGGGAILTLLLGPRMDLMPSTELQEPGRQAAVWLREQGDMRVRSSFESAPVIHLGGQEWDPWPSRWDPDAWTDPERKPDLVVLTDLDDYASPSDGPPMSPVAYYGDERSWVLVLALDNP